MFPDDYPEQTEENPFISFLIVFVAIIVMTCCIVEGVAPGKMDKIIGHTPKKESQ